MPQRSIHKQAGLPFIELGTTDSTNNYALRQLHAGLAQDGAAYFAREQLAGKGQRGKSWESGRDTSILLSVVINPQPLPVMQQFELSACIAVSAARFLIKKGVPDIKLKWPNDLYWQDRKTGGILIENIIGGTAGQKDGAASAWRWAVAGIGINLNQVSFETGLKNPVSLHQVTGLNYEPVELAKELHHTIYENCRELLHSGFSGFYASYLSLLYKKDETVKFKKNSRVFEAQVKSVSPDGKLIVGHAIEEAFSFGEIEWLIPPANPEK